MNIGAITEGEGRPTISMIASPTSIMEMYLMKSSCRVTVAQLAHAGGPPTRLFHYDFYYTFSVATATICAILLIAFTQREGVMSALLNTLDQLILEDDAVMEQYVFHVVTRTPYANIKCTLSAYSTYGRGLPRFQLGSGHQREISTAISQFTPTINGRKDYIIPPLSGMILSDSSGANRVTQFASLYVRWGDYGTIPIGILRGFEITKSSILDEHSRRAQLKIAS